jgi:hypothetical protein
MRIAKFDDLANDIVRPDIDKFIQPLALYRGTRSLGQIQSKWNFAIAMMHSECESFSEGVKIANVPSLPHLCEPRTSTQTVLLRSFFSRLHDHPKVTDNVSGLTDYVRMLLPNGGWNLQKVSYVDAGRSTQVPWRIWGDKALRKPRTIIKPRESLFYPYVIHKPENDDGTYELMVLVNEAVPKNYPDFIRADICQDLVVGLLAGDIDPDELRAASKDYAKKVFEMHPLKYGHLSLDAPFGEGDDRTMLDVLAG